MKKSLPYSCGLRVLRSCSEEEDINTNLDLMFTKFARQRYPIELLQETKTKLLQLDRKILIKPSPSFHHEHIQMHNTDIPIIPRQPTELRSENNVFVILPFT